MIPLHTGFCVSMKYIVVEVDRNSILYASYVAETPFSPPLSYLQRSFTRSRDTSYSMLFIIILIRYRSNPRQLWLSLRNSSPSVPPPFYSDRGTRKPNPAHAPTSHSQTPSSYSGHPRKKPTSQPSLPTSPCPTDRPAPHQFEADSRAGEARLMKAASESAGSTLEFRSAQ